MTSSVELEYSPFLGALFESFVAAEILKSQAHQGMRKELYYFRDQQGLEVDFLVPRANSNLWLVEAKAGKTVRPSMATPLLSLRRASPKRSGRLIVVHRKSRSQLPTAAIAGGVEALDVERFIQELVRTRYVIRGAPEKGTPARASAVVFFQRPVPIQGAACLPIGIGEKARVEVGTLPGVSLSR